MSNDPTLGMVYMTKQADSGMEQAGAPSQDNFGITPQMIEAGVATLKDYNFVEVLDGLVDPKECIVEIYLSMIRHSERTENN